MCERSGLPWYVVSHPVGDYRQIEPCGWRADYLGRPYCYAVFDCWELVRDWYARERGVSLPHFNWREADNGDAITFELRSRLDLAGKRAPGGW